MNSQILKFRMTSDNVTDTSVFYKGGYARNRSGFAPGSVHTFRMRKSAAYVAGARPTSSHSSESDVVCTVAHPHNLFSARSDRTVK